MSKTLLEKTMSERLFSKEQLEEGEVYVAWINGDVDSGEVARTLQIPTSQVFQKAGAALRNLRHAGHITISWNKPDRDKGPQDQP